LVIAFKKEQATQTEVKHTLSHSFATYILSGYCEPDLSVTIGRESATKEFDWECLEFLQAWCLEPQTIFLGISQY